MKYLFSEAELIEAIRKVYGYSQKEFCVFLGYSQSTLSKIENGQSSPDMKFVISLAQKLNLDLNIFKYGFVPKIPDYLFKNKGSKLLQNHFLRDGIFPAKMTFLLLENLRTQLDVDLYEKLNVPREIFPFQELRFNLGLFKNILEYVESDKVIDVMNSIKSASPTLIAQSQFKDALMKLSLFQLENMVQLENSCEAGISFNFEVEDSLKGYFEHLLSLYINTELNINSTLISQEKKKFDIVLRLHAS